MQLSKIVKHFGEKANESEEESKSNSGSSSIKDCEFKLFEPILNLVKMNYDVKVVLHYKKNFFPSNKAFELIQRCTKFDENQAQCEIAHSSGGLWFLLSKNIENLDIIHHFSSEKQAPPDAVMRFLKEKDSVNLIKYHYTGSSFEGYYNKVRIVLANQLKEIHGKSFMRNSNQENNLDEAKEKLNSNILKLTKSSYQVISHEGNIEEKEDYNRFAIFENDNDYQVTLDSFVKKFKTKFSSTLDVDLRSFLKTFEELLNEHLNNVTNKEKNSDKFTEEIRELYTLYVLQRIICISPKLVDCPFLENSLKDKQNSIEKIKNSSTVNIKFYEEDKENLSGDQKTGCAPSYCSSMSADHIQINDTNKSSDFDKIINLAINKVANQIYKSGQQIKKTKSLDGIIINILNNICNCKYSSKEWGGIIKSDKDFKNNVINAMANLNIIEISIDGKDLKVCNKKIEEYGKEHFT